MLREHHILTTKTNREPIESSTYPKRFLFLVLIFASLYVSTASVPIANGWYTRERTLEGWYCCVRKEKCQPMCRRSSRNDDGKSS